MGRAIAAGIVLGTAAAACFTTPSGSFGDGGTEGDGRGPDSSTPGSNADGGVDAPVPCKTEQFGETAPATCGSWADTFAGSGSAAQQNGQLWLSLFGMGSAYAECRTDARVFDHAVLDVVGVHAGSGGSNERTYFLVESASERWGIMWLYDNANSGVGIAMTCSTGGTVSTPRLWLPTPERYIQLRRSTGQVVVELGPTPTGPWSTPLGSCSVDDAALSAAKVVVGTSHSSGVAGTAVFDSVVLCP